MGCRVPPYADTESLAVPPTSEQPELPLRRRSSFREPTPRPQPLSAETTEPDDTAAPEDTSEPEDTTAPQAKTAPEAKTAPDRSESTKGRGPRHRAEPVRNRRETGEAFRRTFAIGCVSAIMGVSALGAVAASADDDRVATTATASTALPGSSSATAADTLAATDVEVDDGPTVTSDLSVSAAPFTGGTQVTVTGEQLDEVASVTVGGAPAAILSVAEEQVTFAVPAVAPDALGSAAEVAFTDVAGLAV
jgi:hypothetical protein